MAPTPTPSVPPLVVRLSFPSLAHFLSSSSHLPTIAAAANKTDCLVVRVTTPTTDPSPWSTDSSDPSSAASSSSSSSSPPPSPPPSPVQLWLPLERALAHIYSTASQTFLKRGAVLAQVDVVLDALRGGLPSCPPNGAEVVKWEWRAGEDGARKGEIKDVAEEEEGGKGIYDVAALGGTFDHLHAGHKILLSMACAITQRKLIVGVSDDVLLKNKKYPHLLESLQHRIRTVERFIELVRPSIKHDVVPLQDVYGPTSHDPEIEALVVSDETRAGGDTINDLRLSKSLNPLRIHVINLVADDAALHDAAKHEAVPPVKVEAAAKMGSTGIREWIAKHGGGEEGANGADGGGKGQEAA
ncbi:hypothetical protein JCM8097_007668 [Rhodosporidiobolus ruineniae]